MKKFLRFSFCQFCGGALYVFANGHTDTFIALMLFGQYGYWMNEWFSNAEK